MLMFFVDHCSQFEEGAMKFLFWKRGLVGMKYWNQRISSIRYCYVTLVFLTRVIHMYVSYMIFLLIVRYPRIQSNTFMLQAVLVYELRTYGQWYGITMINLYSWKKVKVRREKCRIKADNISLCQSVKKHLPALYIL